MARPQPGEARKVDPGAMTAGQLAEALSRAGGAEVRPAAVKALVKAGAPTNPDGTINLIQFAAWLSSRMAT